MKQILLKSIFIFILTINFPIFSQGVKEDYAKSSLYIEFLGPLSFLSVNFDYRFHPNYTFRLGSGLSLGFTFPVMINFLTSANSSHHLDLGGGVVGFYGGWGESKGFAVVPALNLGYRFQPKKGGFFFKIAWTPVIYLAQSGETETFVEWGGVSLGYTFN